MLQCLVCQNARVPKAKLMIVCSSSGFDERGTASRLNKILFFFFFFFLLLHRGDGCGNRCAKP